MSASLELTVTVAAKPDEVFAAVTDWESQGDWMLATRVEAGPDGGRDVGGTIAAWTGLGPLGFWDTMEITGWQTPRRVTVLHTGSVVRGTGEFRVEPHASGSRFVWREDLDLPLGAVGAVGWVIVRPVMAWAVRFSLRRFARGVESGELL